jgi:uncharacterized protein YacL
MENLFLIAMFATILFLLIKFIEMKYLDKEMKPMKIVVRDGLIVFVSAILASYGFHYSNSSISDFFNVITENKVMNADATQIFTDNPGF